MKNLKLRRQVTLIIICVLFLSCALFNSLLFFQGRTFAERETFSRLDAIMSLSPNDTEDINTEIRGNMEVVIIRGRLGSSTYEISKNHDKFLTEEDRNTLLSTAIYGREAFDRPFQSGKQSMKSQRNTNLYYIYEVVDGRFFILLTDSSFVVATMKHISLKMFSVFIFVIAIACLIISLWSQGLVSRIRKVQAHVANMPKERYANPYQDNGDDEITELSRSIEDMRTQIEKSEFTKREMLQNISHDLKTPIAVIKSYAESILDGVSDPVDAQIILNQADVLRNKVNELLQYNRLEYLSKDREFEKVNLKEIVTEVVQNYKYQTEIQFDLDLHDVYFNGYRENFYTVVDNIVDNAKRYAETLIKIILKDNELIIYNDGKPIAKEFLNASFKPYEKGGDGQFGLGMSIVKKTIDFFDLKLAVRNEAKGVSFIISKK